MSRHTGPTHVVPVTVVEAHRRNERASEPGPTLSDRELDWDTLPPSDWRYEPERLLARGGMGRVYTARDRLLGRRVVLKVLTDSRMKRRFRREAHIHAHLQHASIPPLFDAGRFADGRCFLAIKHVKGRRLDELAPAPPATPGEMARRLGWFEQVCLAVAYAHGKQILHRDLKPANVLVSHFGRVYVIDWGLAKVKGGPDLGFEDERTDEGTPIGTLAYMAPELIGRGGVLRADERTDVFGLGGMLCAVLTGRPVYDGDTVLEVARTARGCETAPAVRRLADAGAPARLVRLAERCLAPDPADRPASAVDVAQELTAHRVPVTC
jgi:eukaryotic-like serine/threonine-protein kinase